MSELTFKKSKITNFIEINTIYYNYGVEKITMINFCNKHYWMLLAISSSSLEDFKRLNKLMVKVCMSAANLSNV